MPFHRPHPAGPRRGIACVWFAVLSTFVFGMVAFAVDIGWIALVRNHLQVAADAAAMAGVAVLSGGNAGAVQKAKDLAAQNIAGGLTETVTLADSDIEIGTWDTTNKSFAPNASPPNAMRVTARRTLNLFFGGVLGLGSRTVQATAIAIKNPRDIAFILDMSGSMNNDTEIWATAPINGAFSGYPTIGSDLMRDVFTDFGFGTYPGTTAYIGDCAPFSGGGQAVPPGARSTYGANCYNYLINTYLVKPSIPSPYQIVAGDTDATKKTKAYKFLIDQQLKALMPNAKPALNTTTNFAYWSDYLDYIIYGNPVAPANQNAFQMIYAANPYADAWPSLPGDSAWQFLNQVGYLTYVQFMMDYGWNRKAGNSTTYVPLSRNSANCPWRLDTDPNSPGNGLYFPPREQPTHAARLAVMAAIKKIASINSGLAESSKDHVCVITFDTAAGCTIKYPLTATSCDYEAARASLRDIQAVADDQNSTASENGLLKARDHLDPAKNPSGARVYSTKVLVFLSDGIPNVKASTDSDITNFTSNNPQGEWFTTGDYPLERNAVLMQVMQLQRLGWKTNAVGVGLGADRTLMDRMARMAGTGLKDPNNANGPRISAYADGNPADYQSRLTSIFSTIVSTPNVQLVK